MANFNGGIIGKYNVPVDNGQAEVITTFNSSGTLTTGSQTTLVSYLVIAGGAGAGSGVSGGGGAGGYKEATLSNFGVSASTDYSITVGAGGPANNNSATEDSEGHSYGDGGNSVFSSITSAGGGSGGSFQTVAPSTAAAHVGGSGGGVGGRSANANGVGGAAGTSGQGNRGGHRGGGGAENYIRSGQDGDRAWPTGRRGSVVSGRFRSGDRPDRH